MANEKSFQTYFIHIGKPLNYHRIALINGNGFPDIVGFHGAKHSLVELKDLVLGVKGNKKIRPLFKDSQPPWYIRYFQDGGNRLFVSTRITNHDGGDRRYGLWQLTKQIVLDMDDLYYSDLRKMDTYKEYHACKDMVEDIENWGERK